MKNIKAKEIILGDNVFIDPSAIIRGIDGKAKSVIIGDNTFIGQNVQIICDEFKIGDYGKIQHHTNVHGYKPVVIGHNFWCGQYTIIDGIGGTLIGNNVGVGAHSQLWSHIKYGDTLEGCRWNSNDSLIIGDDVWFVGHCIVSPIKAENKSMAMVGSVITKDMKSNRIYAGVPAKDLTEKIGSPFKYQKTADKLIIMQKYLDEFGNHNDNIEIVNSDSKYSNSSMTYFNVSNRRYTKRGTKEEIDFIKFLLPEKAKFIPEIL
jgi:acetyltransferase-like isoleucine patch superfamily enzyme